MAAEKTICLPSGVKVEGSSDTEFEVSFRALPPWAGMTKMSKFPSRLLAKAICFPSGDQMGLHSYESCVVSRMAFPPCTAT